VRTNPRLLAALPALNEEQTVGSVIDEVKAQAMVTEVLVVDDGSADGTGRVARAHGATVLTLPFNVGVGGAMRAAFLYARDHGFDYVVQVDSDGQHDPAQIPLLMSAADEASIVIGARFAGSGDYRVRGPRRWAMKFLAASLSRVTNAQLTDTTSGFRLSDRAAIELFSRHYPAEYLGDTVESLVIAARSGLVVAQVPVSMRPRQGGEASQSPGMAGLYLGRAGLALFTALARRRRHSNVRLHATVEVRA